MPLIGSLVIQFSGNLLAILIDHLIGFPPAAGTSAADRFLYSGFQCLIIYMLRLRHSQILYLFGFQIPGDAIIQNRNTVYGYGHLLICVACTQADGCT